MKKILFLLLISSAAFGQKKIVVGHPILNPSDTAGKWGTSIYRSHDSVFFCKGASCTFSYKDSTGGGGGTVDTTVISTRAWRQKGVDSVISIPKVTSVASGFGTAFSTITSTGSIVVDSSVMATRARVQKGIDSLKVLPKVTSVSSGFGTTFSTITSTGSVIVDSAAIATRARVQKGIDSVAALGKVTSVAAGWGTNFSTITSTGSVVVDSASVASRARVQKGIDSLAGLTFTFRNSLASGDTLATMPNTSTIIMRRINFIAGTNVTLDHTGSNDTLINLTINSAGFSPTIDDVLGNGNTTNKSMSLTSNSAGINWSTSHTALSSQTNGLIVTNSSTSHTNLIPISTGRDDTTATLYDLRNNAPVTTNNTVTLSNKRWTARVGSTTSSATPTINTDNYDIYKLTAQAVDITSMSSSLSGSPSDGDILEIQITGTASRNITWGSSFVSSTVTLPTATSGTATLTVIFQYCTTSSYGNNKYVCANYY